MNATVVGRGTTTVTTMRQALQVAMAARGGAMATGEALESVLVFLKEQNAIVLHKHEAPMEAIFDAFGFDRAVRMASWLARRTGDLDALLFWVWFEDRTRRARELGELAAG